MSGMFWMTLTGYEKKVVIKALRGNVGENQRGVPTCRYKLCSYSGYQKYS